MAIHNFSVIGLIKEAKNGKLYIEKEAGKFQSGDTLEISKERFEKIPSKGRRAKCSDKVVGYTVTQFKITGIGKEFEAGNGDKVCRYYGYEVLFTTDLGGNVEDVIRGEIEDAKRIEEKQEEEKAEKEEARDQARLFGGAALKGGDNYRKHEAEIIRAEKIEGMSDRQAMLAVDPSGLGRNASFWIKNKKASALQVGQFFEKQKDLISKYKQAQEDEDLGAIERLSDEYNSLTKLWGLK